MWELKTVRHKTMQVIGNVMNLTKKQDNKNSNENGEVDICVRRQGIEQSWLEQFSPTTNKREQPLHIYCCKIFYLFGIPFCTL